MTRRGPRRPDFKNKLDIEEKPKEFEKTYTPAKSISENKFKKAEDCSNFIIHLKEISGEGKEDYPAKLMDNIYKKHDDFSKMLYYVFNHRRYELFPEIVDLISSLKSTQISPLLSSLFFTPNFILSESLNMYLQITSDPNERLSNLPDFLKNICSGSPDAPDVMLSLIENEEEYWKKLNRAKIEQIKNILNEINQHFENAMDYESQMFPDELSLKVSKKFTTKLEDGCEDIKELTTAIFEREAEANLRPIRKYIKYYRQGKKEMSNFCVYEKVKVLPMKVKSMRYFPDTSSFVYFYPDHVRDYTIDWEADERLKLGTLLLFSRSEKLETIDAYCFSTVPMFREKQLNAEIMTYLKEGILPVRIIKGRLAPGEEYHMFEPRDSFQVSLYRMEALKKFSDDSFRILQDAIIKHDFNMDQVEDVNHVLYNVNILKKPKEKEQQQNQNDEEQVEQERQNAIDENDEEEDDSYFAFACNDWFPDMTDEEIDNNLRVDHEQLMPIKHAVEYPLTLVNGHPGTGKTHTATELVRLLLTSQSIQHIFIVAQTNHTVDAMIKGLLKFIPKYEILRHGGKFSVDDEDVKNRQVNYDKLKEYYKVTNYYDRSKQRAQNTLNIINYQYLTCKIFTLAQKVWKYTKSKDKPMKLRDKIVDLMKQFVAPLFVKFDFEKVFKFPFYSDDIDRIVEKPKPEQYLEYWIIGESYFIKEMKKLKEQYKIDKMKQIDIPDLYNRVEGEVPDIKIDPNFDFPNIPIISKCLRTPKNYNEDEDEEYMPYTPNDNEEFDDDTPLDFYEDDIMDDFDLQIEDQQDKKTIKGRKLELIEPDELKYHEIAEMRCDEFDGFLQYAILYSRLHQEERFDVLLNFLKKILEILLNRQDHYNTHVKYFEEKLNIEKNNAMAMLFKTAKVIVMTATQATKFKSAIDQCGCNFLIIEEASELTEGATIGSLPLNAKHLVMIGDYQQLRPHVDYSSREEIDEFNAYDISTFERLVKAAKDSHCLFELNFQRRYHDNIAQVVRNSFCPNLVSNPALAQLELVPGLPHRINFILMDKFKEASVKDHTSKVNKEEAKYAIGLLFMLLCRLVPPDKVTILTLYKKQAEYIKRKLAKYYFQKKNIEEFRIFDPFVGTDSDIYNINVQCIDNFQGEENDYIILSTVRSEAMGFSKNRNRILVALTRVRNQLFILGNPKLLRDKEKSNEWADIIQYCEQHYNGSVTEKGLYISCEHKQDGLYLKDFDDLWKYRFGNCEHYTEYENQIEKCGCNHKRRQYCSSKILPCQNLCGHKCEHQDCEGICDQICCICQNSGHHHCPVEYDVWCDYGHCYKVSCQVFHSEEKPRCNARCNQTVPPCGCQCALPCYHNGTSPHKCRPSKWKCEVCGQTQIVECKAKAVCRGECHSILYCGHKCQGRCGQPCICNRVCEYVFPCGHKCNMECSNHTDDHQHLICHKCSDLMIAKNFSCNFCGKRSSVTEPSKSCKHDCKCTCRYCDEDDCCCRSYSGEQCVFNCQAKEYPKKVKLFMLGYPECDCIVTKEEAEKSIREQMNAILTPNKKDPEQIHHLVCPRCKKAPITKSWYFLDQISKIAKIVEDTNKMAESMMKAFIKDDPEKLRHKFKFIYCKCGTINIFDIVSNGKQSFKCSKCKNSWRFSDELNLRAVQEDDEHEYHSDEDEHEHHSDEDEHEHHSDDEPHPDVNERREEYQRADDEDDYRPRRPGGPRRPFRKRHNSDSDDV